MEISSGTTINLNNHWEKDFKLERDCNALSSLFASIILDMKGSYPIWEEFAGRSIRFASAIKNTQTAMNCFLESFQKVADIATHAKGATKDIGTALTRLQLRHKNIENRLKSLSTCLVESVAAPIENKLEDWKKSVNQLDKDHAKDSKRIRNEVKKASSETVRLKKKAKKAGRPQELTHFVEKAVSDEYSRKVTWEEMEKSYVRRAMIEERGRFCTFVGQLRPVLDQEINLFGEINHLQEVVENLCEQATDPFALPPTSEQVLDDLKDSLTQHAIRRTPPSSPSSLGSRKSSMCSISSIASSSSDSTNSSNPLCPPPVSNAPRSKRNSIASSAGSDLNINQPLYATIRRSSKAGAVARLSSVSSHDSGFMSQDTLFPRPPSPPAVSSSNENDTQSTWTNWPEAPLGLDARHDSGAERPHTISAAYERLHTRPAITAQTFEPPKVNDPEAPPLPYRPPGAFGRPILHDDSKTPTEEDQVDCLQQASNADSLSEAIKQLENCTAQLQASESSSRISSNDNSQKVAKPPPPLRRSSTITMADFSSLPPPPPSFQEPIDMSLPSCDDLPPPPPELLMPPPPEPLVSQTYKAPSTISQKDERNAKQVNNNKVLRRHHSIAETHASVMHALNSQLLYQQKSPSQMHPTSLALKQSSIEALDLDEVTPTQDNGGTLLERAIKFRKTLK